MNTDEVNLDGSAGQTATDIPPPSNGAPPRDSASEAPPNPNDFGSAPKYLNTFNGSVGVIQFQGEKSSGKPYDVYNPDFQSRLEEIYIQPSTFDEASEKLRQDRLVVLSAPSGSGRLASALKMAGGKTACLLRNINALDAFLDDDEAPVWGIVPDYPDHRTGAQTKVSLAGLRTRLEARNRYLVITTTWEARRLHEELRGAVVAWKKPNAVSALATHYRAECKRQEKPPFDNVRELLEANQDALERLALQDYRRKAERMAEESDAARWSELFQGENPRINDLLAKSEDARLAARYLSACALFGCSMAQIEKWADRLEAILYNKGWNAEIKKTAGPLKVDTWLDDLRARRISTEIEIAHFGTMPAASLEFEDRTLPAEFLKAFADYFGPRSLLIWFCDCALDTDAAVRHHALKTLVHLAENDFVQVYEAAITRWSAAGTNRALHVAAQFLRIALESETFKDKIIRFCSGVRNMPKSSDRDIAICTLLFGVVLVNPAKSIEDLVVLATEGDAMAEGALVLAAQYDRGLAVTLLRVLLDYLKPIDRGLTREERDKEAAKQARLIEVLLHISEGDFFDNEEAYNPLIVEIIDEVIENRVPLEKLYHLAIREGYRRQVENLVCDILVASAKPSASQAGTLTRDAIGKLIFRLRKVNDLPQEEARQILDTLDSAGLRAKETTGQNLYKQLVQSF